MLFKAIKMGDISFISDYFGVALINGNNNDDGNSDADFYRPKWYVEDLPDSRSANSCKWDGKDSFVKTQEGKIKRKVDVFGSEGLTPLHAAAQIGSIDIVQFLLSVGSSPMIR